MFSLYKAYTLLTLVIFLVLTVTSYPLEYEIQHNNSLEMFSAQNRTKMHRMNTTYSSNNNTNVHINIMNYMSVPMRQYNEEKSGTIYCVLGYISSFIIIGGTIYYNYFYRRTKRNHYCLYNCSICHNKMC